MLSNWLDREKIYERFNKKSRSKYLRKAILLFLVRERKKRKKEEKKKDALKENIAVTSVLGAMSGVMNDYAVLKGHMTRGYCSHLWTSTSLRFNES